MYDFLYRHIKVEYPGERSKLLYTDTDSFVFAIESVDISRDMLARSECFDCSNYPRDHRCYSNENKKVIGKFKDELAGNIMTEFVALRAKMYAFTYNSDVNPAAERDGLARPREVKKCKGIARATVRKELTFAMYKHCLQSRRKRKGEMNVIRSDRHQVFTQKVWKVALSSYDDKRFLLDDVSSLPYGHYRIASL